MAYYYYLSSPVKAEYKIKSSEFIVRLKPVESVPKAKDFIKNISHRHIDASHNCWAYIVGKNADTFHASDAGEPPGTAGKPILNSLKKYSLTNIAAVVTRYFGGTKLGIRGLINAYSGTVIQTVKKTTLKKLVEYKRFCIQTDYAFLDEFKFNLQQLEAKLENIRYTTVIDMNVKIEAKKDKELMITR